MSVIPGVETSLVVRFDETANGFSAWIAARAIDGDLSPKDENRGSDAGKPGWLEEPLAPTTGAIEIPEALALPNGWIG